MEDKKQCKKCKRRYHYIETASLCCSKRGGCGQLQDPFGIISDECGETVKDGKWYFCKSCQRKKQK